MGRGLPATCLHTLKIQRKIVRFFLLQIFVRLERFQQSEKTENCLYLPSYMRSGLLSSSRVLINRYDCTKYSLTVLNNKKNPL